MSLRVPGSRCRRPAHGSGAEPVLEVVAARPTPDGTAAAARSATWHKIATVPTLLVFGARNLGRAIGRHLADEGWDVVAVARSQESLDRVRAEIPHALTFSADATVDEEVDRVFAEARQRFGSIDLVVVAISPATRGRAFGGGSFLEAGREAIAPYVEELLPGLFTVLRIGSRVLAEQGSGTYVQITGGSARRGMPGRGAWSAAAFATRALIQSAAGELRERGVHVALLIVDATIESEKTAEALAGRPQSASTSEEDVARAVAYLARQSPRGWTHELQITPSGDRWVP
jgi:NAD(P)-dependent dehydrogenase (short-subunit alcohol dehydrogenase family)